MIQKYFSRLMHSLRFFSPVCKPCSSLSRKCKVAGGKKVDSFNCTLSSKLETIMKTPANRSRNANIFINVIISFVYYGSSSLFGLHSNSLCSSHPGRLSAIKTSVSSLELRKECKFFSLMNLTSFSSTEH